MATRVFTYGCAQPPMVVQLTVGEQMRLAHRYQNDLIELENSHREAMESLRLSHSPAYAAAVTAEREAESVVLEAVAACQAAKARTGSATAPDDERQAVAVARAALAVARNVARQERRVVHASEAWRKDRDAERIAHVVRRKAAYAASALFWGTKNAVAEAVERAAADSPYGPLRFRRWTRNGRLYCQVMNGIDPATAHACTDGRLQIERVPGSRRRAVVRVRIGSSGPGNRRPVWAELPTVVHRPLPALGTIKGVAIVRRQGRHQFAGGRPVARDEWAVHITVDIPDETSPARPGVVAVDVGWRRMPNGSLRVAAWVDDAGHRGELCLPPAICALWPAAEESQAERDRLFNMARDRLADWIGISDVSDELREATATVRQWRGVARLHGLIARFPELRGESQVPDGVVVQASQLRDWQYADSRIEMRLTCDVRNREATRLDLFRVFAAELGTRYGTVVVESLDMRRMRENPLPEDTPDEVRNRWRNAAAVGLLLSCIRQQGRAEVVALDPAGTTSTCHACGSTQVFDRRKLEHDCTACGAAWDQDENAAMNLLARFRERAGAAETLDPARGDQPNDGQGVVAEAAKPKRVRRTRRGDRSKQAVKTQAEQGVLS